MNPEAIGFVLPIKLFISGRIINAKDNIPDELILTIVIRDLPLLRKQLEGFSEEEKFNLNI